MSFAINMLVLGMCWFAMVWLSGRSHGFGEHGNEHGSDGHVADYDVHYVAMPVSDPGPDAPCMACEGVGATHAQGRLTPCSECYGTGLFAG